MMREERAFLRRWAGAAAVTLTVGLVACRPAPVAAAVQPMEKGTVTTTRATVTAIDLERRLVTLKGPEGKEFVVTVGKEVQNLPKVKVGDDVITRYYEAVALQIHKAGNAKMGITKTEKTHRSMEGGSPAGITTTKVTANLKVVVVNPRDKSVTLTGPSGYTRWVKVRDPKLQPYVKTLKQGDIVSIVYTEATAVSVEPASSG